MLLEEGWLRRVVRVVRSLWVRNHVARIPIISISMVSVEYFDH
jgi:hypothetical protein